jgi:hypothetical protein
VEAVQVEGIQSLARNILQPAAMNVTLVGAFGEAEKKALKARLE